MGPVTRLVLVRHATSAETRAARFPATTGARAEVGCAPLDGPGRQMAADLGHHLPAADHVWSSWAVRARETAAVAGLEAQPTEELAECDFGTWAGRTIADVATADPEGFAAWATDPTQDTHGGEPLAVLLGRARSLLGRIRPGSTIAFTHGGFIRAVVVEALAMPPSRVGRVDVAPASVTELHRHDGSWRLVRLNWTPQVRPLVTSGTSR